MNCPSLRPPLRRSWSRRAAINRFITPIILLHSVEFWIRNEPVYVLPDATAGHHLNCPQALKSRIKSKEFCPQTPIYYFPRCSPYFFIFWRSAKSNRHPLKSELASPECARWFPFAGAIDLLSLLARRALLRRRTARFLSAIASKDQLIYNFYNPINIALRAIFASVVRRSIADVKRRTIVTRTAKRGPKRGAAQKWKQKVIHQHG